MEAQQTASAPAHLSVFHQASGLKSGLNGLFVFQILYVVFHYSARIKNADMWPRSGHELFFSQEALYHLNYVGHFSFSPSMLAGGSS